MCCVFLFCLGLWKERTISDKARRSQQLVSTSHSSSHGSCSKLFISREASIPSAQKTDNNGYYNWPICWRMGPPYSVAVPMCSQLKGWVWVKTNRGWAYEATNMGMYVEIKWQTNEANVMLEISPRITDPRIKLFIMTFTIGTVDGAYPPFWIKPYWLVVEPHPSEKYEFVSWDDDIPNMWKVIKFHGSKAPTSFCIFTRDLPSGNLT